MLSTMPFAALIALCVLEPLLSTPVLWPIRIHATTTHPPASIWFQLAMPPQEPSMPLQATLDFLHSVSRIEPILRYL